MTATRWRSSTSTTPGPHRPSTTSPTTLEFDAPFRDDAECIRWMRFAEPPDRRHRIEVFAEAYGLTSTDGLVDRVIELQAQDVREVGALAEGVEPQASWVARGYDAELSARVRWSEENRHLFGPDR